ncbi:MAG: glycosyltransferase family 4 protein [Solirubrobacteraceae bacterium MAG38_C4-C5]|nr:glycosyltransferase family 4 protein [Candidatus Siliceabacter maunaloa]
MPTVLHVLPHAGGGGQTYVDLLEGCSSFVHERLTLSTGRTPAQAVVSLPARWPAVARAARRADLVHVHGDTAALLALALLRARPSVVTTHGLHLLRRVRGPMRAGVVLGLRAAAQAADRVICTSHAERDELAGLLPAPARRRLVVVHNGIALPSPADPAQRSAARGALGLANGDVAVLFLGELHERKAPLDAVAAAQAARTRGARVVLLVAGDGPQASAVRERAGPAVRPLGFRGDVDRLLTAADLLVMPSAREGLSFAVLEAMGRGLALVVSDAPGNPEAVGDAGVVVPVGDRAALATALTRLATDHDERARLGAAARERVRTTFTLDRLREEVSATYHDALSRSHQSA